MRVLAIIPIRQELELILLLHILKVEERARSVRIRARELLKRSRLPCRRPPLDKQRRHALRKIGVLHELGRNSKLSLKRLGDAPLATDAHLAESDVYGRRRTLMQRLEGPRRPLLRSALLTLQRLHDLLDGVEAEAPVDGLAKFTAKVHGLVVRDAAGELLDGVVDEAQARLEVIVVAEAEFAETVLEIDEAGRVEVVRGDARVEHVGSVEPVAREGEVGTDGAVHSGEEERGANVWEEADCGLRHGEDSPLRGYPEGSVDAEADTATHGNTVHEGNVGLLVGSDIVVELVFESEVLGRFSPSSLGAVHLGEGSNVTAGAESLGTRALHDDHVGHVGFLPFDHSGEDLADHRRVEGVELLGSVELDRAKAVLAADDNIVGLVFGKGLKLGGEVQAGLSIGEVLISKIHQRRARRKIINKIKYFGSRLGTSSVELPNLVRHT